MIIIGINWEQNSSASLMIIFSLGGLGSSENSQAGLKMKDILTELNWLLKRNNIKKSQVDEISFISTIWSPSRVLTRYYTSFSIDDYITEQKLIWYPRIYKNKKISHLNIFKNKIDNKQFPGQDFWNPVIQKYQKMVDHVSNKNIVKEGHYINSLTYPHIFMFKNII